MSRPSTFEQTARRHRLTGQDYLTSLVAAPNGQWEIVASKLDHNSKLEIEERTVGNTPHPSISGIIAELQNRYDSQYQDVRGKEAEQVALTIRHLSCILHIGAPRILNCLADDDTAQKIAEQIESSCERVRSGLGLATEISQIGQSIQSLGCGRVIRAA